MIVILFIKKYTFFLDIFSYFTERFFSQLSLNVKNDDVLQIKKGTKIPNFLVEIDNLTFHYNAIFNPNLLYVF